MGTMLDALNQFYLSRHGVMGGDPGALLGQAGTLSYDAPQPLPQIAPPASAPVAAQPSVDLQALQSIPQMGQTTKIGETSQGISPEGKAALAESAQNIKSNYGQQLDYLKATSQAEKEQQDVVDKKLNTTPLEQATQAVAFNQAAVDALKKNVGEIDGQIEKLKNFKFQNFWADKSSEYKVKAAISVGLGALAQGLSGVGENIGMTLLQKAMDDDSRMQQQAYSNVINSINLLKLSADQKNTLMTRAKNQYDAYKIARFDAVQNMVQDQVARNPKLASSPELQQAMFALNNSREATIQNVIKDQYDRIATTSAVQQSPLTPSDWKDQAKPDSGTNLGNYNKAVDDYNFTKNLDASGLQKAIIVNLIANKLNQNSYDPAKFDLRSMSTVGQYADALTEKFAGPDATKYVAKVKELIARDLDTAYDNVKGQIPAAMIAGKRHFNDINAYVRKLPAEALLRAKKAEYPSFGLRPGGN
jgi:hypothetical protein